ncbi:MAG: hypothetical protein DDT20_00315 [Firmicutes bacterium]|nr:hypothetical protein [Bacillota bacterium]
MRVPEDRRHSHEFVGPEYHEWPFPDTFDPAAHADSALIPHAVQSPPVDLHDQWDYPYIWGETYHPYGRLDTV